MRAAVQRERAVAGHQPDPDDGFLAPTDGLDRALHDDGHHDGGDNLGRLVADVVFDLGDLGVNNRLDLGFFGQLEFFLDDGFGVLAHGLTHLAVLGLVCEGWCAEGWPHH